jgi:hypothetical protein
MKEGSNISPEHSAYELFLQVFVIDSIPLLVNGKTDRQALLRMYEEQYTGNGGEKISLSTPSPDLSMMIFHILYMKWNGIVITILEYRWLDCEQWRT